VGHSACAYCQVSLMVVLLMVKDLADCPGQYGRREWLFNQYQAGIQLALVNDYVFGISRHIDDAEIGALPRKQFGELTSVHLRHDDIGQKKVDASIVSARYLESLVRPGGLQNDVTVELKDLAGELSNAIFILDQQDRLSPPDWRRFGRLR